MKLKLTYTVYLFPFLVGSLSASTVELQQIDRQQVSHQVNTLVDNASSDSNKELNDDEFAKAFNEKEIKITLAYYDMDHNEKNVEETFSPDPNRVKKLLKKLRKPSKVPFTTFLNDYIAQLKEWEQLIKPYRGIRHFFDFKKYNFSCFHSLSHIGSQLRAMYYAVEHGANLVDVKEEMSQTKKEVLSKLIFVNSYDLHCLKFSCYRNSLLIALNAGTYPYIKEHLQNNIAPINTSATVHVFLVSDFVALIPILYAIATKKCKKAMWLFIFCAVDIGLIFPFNFILSYPIEGFLCNPLGLLILPWYYYTMKYIMSPMSHPSYEKFAKWVKKEKEIAIDINSTEDRIQFLDTVLMDYLKDDLVKNKQDFPKSMARVINSFLDRGLSIQKTYPNQIKDMQSNYYKEVAPLSFTSAMPYFTWFNFCKVMTIASFAIDMLIGGFYFGVSLFSIARAIDRAS